MQNLKYKLYKSKKTKRLQRLNQIAGIIWNHCIALTKRYYRMYKKYLSSNKLQKHIAKLRKRNVLWQQLNSQTVQEICQRVDTAYQRFFKKKSKRPPKFKKSKKFSSFVFKNSGYKIIENRLIINGVGTFKFKQTRNYENVKRVILKRDAVGEYYVIMTCDMQSKTYKRRGNARVGMDFGLKTFLTLSNHKKIESPLFYQKNQKKLAALNKNLSSKPKNKSSKNKTKARVNLAKSYRDMSNRRENHHLELAHELCKEYNFIAIEDLNISAMKKRWGKKISDLSFSSFVSKLEQVAPKYGTVIQKVGKFFPSSKLCSSCQAKKEDLSLKEREWQCTPCGTMHDRDINAAKNILSEQGCACVSKCYLYASKSKTAI